MYRVMLYLLQGLALILDDNMPVMDVCMKLPEVEGQQ